MKVDDVSNVVENEEKAKLCLTIALSIREFLVEACMSAFEEITVGLAPATLLGLGLCKIVFWKFGLLFSLSILFVNTCK